LKGCVIRINNDNKEILRKKRKAARKKKIPTATVLSFRLCLFFVTVAKGFDL
jgi:hypothetical protein